MNKEIPERITYAQAKLIKMIEERKLRRWCIDNGIIHSAAYRLAIGEQVPTYKIMASMCHLIAPIEWLFFTDEKLPYEPVLLPKWSCEKPCKFVKNHHYDYKTIAQKYNLEESNAYNIFVAYRANPSPIFIKAACQEINPIEFFIDSNAEVKPLKEYIPERGDIISIDGKLLLIITKQKQNKKYNCFTGCLIVSEEEGFELKGTQTKGYINSHKLFSFDINYNAHPTLIEKISEKIIEKVIKDLLKELQ